MKRETIERILKQGRPFEAGAGGVFKVVNGASVTVYAIRGKLVVAKVVRLLLADDAMTVWTDRGETYTFECEGFAALKVEESTVRAAGRPGFAPDA
ncbi:MAG: hypothetical protein HYY84_04970 [Deltaproteobacteria bacterium]|nr:hypothetical protein [Deltaproteobacteria bacterium]